MITLIGNKIELIRYEITYRENDIDMSEYCITDEERERIKNSLKERDIKYIVKSIPQDCEWMRGLQFDNIDDAKAAMNMGEKTYKDKLISEKEKENERLLLKIKAQAGLQEQMEAVLQELILNSYN